MRWAYRCQQAVQQDIAADFAKDGLTPKQRRDKERRELVAKLTDTSDINVPVAENKRSIEEGRKQLREPARQMGCKTPMERMAEKAKLMQQELDKLKALYPADLPAGSAPAIEAEMTMRFPLKLHGLPKQPSPEMKAKSTEAAAGARR